MKTTSPDSSEPSVLHSDNHLLFVRKPAGMPAQADESEDLDILSWGKQWIKETTGKPGNVYLGLVHRLDRPVSGVMVLARTSKAAARLTNQFKARSVKKRYLAVVQGRLEGAGDYRDHLLKQDRQVRVVSANHPRGKAAHLSWRVLESGHQHSLVVVTLHTGRPHQVRVQFASRKHPLVGDLRYGASQSFDGRNLALHCCQLEISHPTRKEPVGVVLPPPSSWSGFHQGAVAAYLQALEAEADA